MAACGIPENVLEQLGRDERSIVAVEASNDPKLCRAVVALSRTPGWTKTVDDMIRRVILNEVNQKSHLETAGKWPMLRIRVRKLTSAATAAVEDQLSKLKPGQEIPEAIRIERARRARPLAGLGDLGDLGQWAELAGAVVQAAAGVYGAKVTSDAQKKIAKMKTQAEMAQLSAQMSMINAQQAVAAQQAQARTQPQFAPQYAPQQMQEAPTQQQAPRQQYSAPSSGASYSSYSTPQPNWNPQQQQQQVVQSSDPFAFIKQSMGGMGDILLPIGAGFAIYLLFGQNKKKGWF